ncbi:virulence-associated E family protein [Amphibacillus sp. MSJ-3]|uniref:virulence-associated E family protein n=1 Tax=Amphibacillus sp. MSJ-3 TaxID=2841505 RepID=UPI001C0EAA37|nr:virulence-associated E family protein [Amphibacillus sp. MSJ-3]MBU5594899.1 virulence-associated E family protein [Amphibacillus sp. MSJ-3]
MQWKNREMLWSDLAKRLSNTTRTGETQEEYRKSAKGVQVDIKDVGGFVGGTLKGGRRKADAVVWRQLITLDADFIKGDFWTSVELMYDFACLAYSTHSHSSNNQRIRLVIPLTRPITPDEYQAVSRRLAADVGIDFFDDTTYQAHRLMYWPSTSQDAEFFFKLQDEPWLNPDDVLDRYPDWTDPSYWPESSRVHQSRQKMADRQGDPFEKPGLIGAFCRAYSIPEAIEAFLGDIYKQEDDGRYSYIKGSTSGGLVLYEGGKFAYSHHGTDPVGGQLVNSFDLVRIHKFGVRDEDAKEGTPIVRMPSYSMMTDFSGRDEKVKHKLGLERLEQASQEFDVVEVATEDNNEWLKKLERHPKTGAILSTRHNALLVLENDGNLKNKLAYDEFSHRPVMLGDLPWENAEKGGLWSDDDESALFYYLESVYDIDSPGKVRDALGVLMKRHRVHPVKDYLKELEWDGEKRLETVLIDYLGVSDTKFDRTVTRKALTAAVARIFRPGVKFDYMLTITGPQGAGKSLLLDKLGGDWFSDSLTTVQGKEAYEQLQGVWLIEMSELSATRKADNEAIKQFLSKREDIFRVAYDRQISVFPRQCIFIGTTNDHDFLRDRTGNRRFWPVVVDESRRNEGMIKDLSKETVDQIWAEAVANYKRGEKLYLEEEDMQQEAFRRQELHREENPTFGLVQKFLEMKLPADWDDRDLSQRRMFLDSDFGQVEGTVQRDRVCALEIWVEVLGGDPKNFRPVDARNINDILREMPGWIQHRSTLRFGKLYGQQRAFVRDENM